VNPIEGNDEEPVRPAPAIRDLPKSLTVWPRLDPVTQTTLFLTKEPAPHPYLDALFHQLQCHGDSTVFVDVGMHSGYFALHARRRGCQVLGFEVQPSCVKLFRLAEQLNRIGPMTEVIYQPVGQRDGERFELNFPDSCEGIYSLFWKGAIHLDSITLDTALAPLLAETPGARILMMKIDIEGFEPRAIAGAMSLIRQRLVDALLVEATWWPNVFSPVSQAYELLSAVFEHGYSIRCLGPPEVYAAEYVDAENWLKYGRSEAASKPLNGDTSRLISVCDDYLICIRPCPYGLEDQ